MKRIVLFLIVFNLCGSVPAQDKMNEIKDARTVAREFGVMKGPEVIELLRTAYRDEIANRDAVIKNENTTFENRLKAWGERDACYQHRENVFILFNNFIVDKEKGSYYTMPYKIENEPETGTIADFSIYRTSCTWGFSQGSFRLLCSTSGLDDYNKLYVYTEDKEGKIDKTKFIIFNKDTDYLIAAIREDKGKTPVEILKQQKQHWFAWVNLGEMKNFKQFIIRGFQ